jgi:hypothetical protein
MVDHPVMESRMQDPSLIESKHILAKAGMIADAINNADAEFSRFATLLASNNSKETLAELDPNRHFLIVDNYLRDAYPAIRLRELCSSVNGKVLYICGAAHMLRDPRNQTVRSFLEEVNIQVSHSLLNEYR